MRIRRHWIVKGADVGHDVFHCRRLQSRFESGLGFLEEIGGILTIDDPARDDGAGKHLSAVAAAGTHIEHLHARAHAGKG